MVNILTEEIKNTRLILTGTVLFMVTLFGMAIFGLAFMGRELPDFYQGAITTLLGFLISQATQAFVSYFKNQEVVQAEKVEIARIEAAKVP
jgi:uncharacterized membrane protein YjjP (DUF1212 family)